MDLSINKLIIISANNNIESEQFMLNYIIASPDEKNKIELNLIDCYMHGPNRADNFIPYYKLLVNGFEIKNRYFTENCIFSLNSSYFAITEWNLEGDSSRELVISLKNSYVKLIIFDLDNQTNGIVSINHGGIITPKLITKDKIIYIKENGGLTRELEVNLSDIKWKLL